MNVKAQLTLIVISPPPRRGH